MRPKMTYGYVDVILVSVVIAVRMGEQDLEIGSKVRKEDGWVGCFEEILALSP